MFGIVFFRARNQINQETRSFVLKHVFKNVSTVKDMKSLISPTEDHFGVPWLIGISHNKDHLGVYLYCARSENKKEWSIDTEFEIHILHPNGNSSHKSSGISHCFTKPIGRGPNTIMTWERMEKECLLNDELIVEIRVKIIKITGIEDFHVSESDDSFVLKYVFKNVSKMKDSHSMSGSCEDHFGVPWLIDIWREKEQLGVYLCCGRYKNEKEWSIDTEYEIHILHPNGIPAHKASVFSHCFTKPIGRGPNTIMTWERMEKDFLLNDELVVEIHVKITKITGIEDFHVSESNDSFVLKYVFKNVSNMKDSENMSGSCEDHFGVPWFISICNKKEHLGVFLHCNRSEKEKEWSIDTEFEVHVLHPNGNSSHKSPAISTRFTKAIGYGREKLMTWERMEEEFLLNDELVVEIHVKITKITGIEDFYVSESDDSFVLKYVFKNVSKMKDTEDCFSSMENYFGVPWCICIKNNKEHLGVSLACQRRENKKGWSIDTEYEIHVLHPNGNSSHKSSAISTRFTKATNYGRKEFMTWERMEKEFLLNDELVVEIHVKITNMEGIEGFHSSMSETVDALSTFKYRMDRRPRSFVLKHVFNNLSKIKDTEKCYGSTENHFGIPWRICIKNNKEHLGIYLYCRSIENKKEWSIDTEFEIHVLHPNENSFHKASASYCYTERKKCGLKKLMTWGRMEKEFLLNDELVVEIHVKITNMEGIEGFHSSMSETVDKLSFFKDKLNQKSRSFLLKHKFKNVSEMEDNEASKSPTEDHYGIGWYIGIWHEKEHLAVFLFCNRSENDEEWSIDTEFEIHTTYEIYVLHPNGNSADKTFLFSFCFTENHGYGRKKFMEWEKMMEEYIVNDELLVEIRVKITKITGIEVFLRRFDDEDRSDMVLVANERKFYVSKLLLASQSSYFKSMLLGKIYESEKTEIELTGIDGYNLQKYLEMLYGEDALDDETVEGILQIAGVYDTKSLIKRCEEYLSEVSRKTLKEKLEISVKYKLVELKKKCMSEMETGDDVRSVIIERIRDMDHNTLTDLLEKTLVLK